MSDQEDEMIGTRSASASEAPGSTRRARVGDWLVEPGPVSARMWRWGRITAVLPDGRHVRVRWYGDDRDTVVQPSPDARIEDAGRAPQWEGDAFGLLPGV
jgi:hypothetical protein